MRLSWLFYKRERNSRIRGFGNIDLYFPELTAANLAKFMISPLGFEYSLGCEKFEFVIDICYLLAKIRRQTKYQRNVFFFFLFIFLT